jgi:hypothetical protein
MQTLVLRIAAIEHPLHAAAIGAPVSTEGRKTLPMLRTVVYPGGEHVFLSQARPAGLESATPGSESQGLNWPARGRNVLTPSALQKIKPKASLSAIHIY